MDASSRSQPYRRKSPTGSGKTGDIFPRSRPPYTSQFVLFPFLIVFAGLLASCEVLEHICVDRDGFQATPAGLYYGWTYGPTAVIAVILALWARVEYHSKRTTQWRSMLQEPTEATRGVLLDYTSDIQPVAIFRAVRNGHYSVALTVSCSLILRALLVFVTGLFAVRSITLVRNGAVVNVLDSIVGDPSPLLTAGSLPVQTLNGILLRDIPYPDGTTPEYAYQRLDDSHLPYNSALSAPVEVFSAGLTCEEADIRVGKWEYVTEYIDNIAERHRDVQDIQFISPSCTVLDATISVPPPHHNGSSDRWTSLEYGNCEEGVENESRRIIISTGELFSSNTSHPHNMSLEASASGIPYERYLITQDRNITWSNQMICTPTYSITRMPVMTNTSIFPPQNDLQVQAGVGYKLPYLSAWDILEAHYQILRSPNITTTNLIRSAYNTPNYTSEELLYGIILSGLATIETITPGTITSTADLSFAAKHYYQTLSAQIAKQLLLQPGGPLLEGNLTSPEDRLVMPHPPLRVVEAFLSLLILLTLVLIFITPRDEARYLATLPMATVARIVAYSGVFRDLFRGTGAMPLDAFRARLEGKRYRLMSSAGWGSTFSVRVSADENGGDSSNSDPERSAPDVNDISWNPFPSLIVRICVFVLIAGIIVALEVGLHFSRKNQGLGDVDRESYVFLVWKYIPVLLMVGIAMFYGSLDSITRLLAPFARLRRGASFEDCMRVDFQDGISPLILVKAVHKRYWAVAATAGASMLGALMIIPASGLFRTADMPLGTSVQLIRDTWFDSGMAGGGYSTSLMIYENASYPTWTYDDLAFPSLSIFDEPQFTTGAFLETRIPALRLRLECTLLDGDALNATLEKAYLKYNSGVQIANTTAACGGSVPAESNSYFSAEPAPDCEKEGWAYAWGRVGDVQIDNVALLSCNEAFEEVDVDAKFLLPGFEIDPAHPPVPDESTVRPSSIRLPSLDLDSDFPSTDNSVLPGLPGPLVQAAIAKGTITLEDLSNRNQNTKVGDALKELIRITRAQQVGNGARIPSSEAEGADTTLTGTFTNPHHTRVVQDATSTHIVVGLLAATLILGILASCLLNTRGLLAKNPSSLASMASLLADSNILIRVATGAAIGNINDRLFLGWVGSNGPLHLPSGQNARAAFTVHAAASSRSHPRSRGEGSRGRGQRSGSPDRESSTTTGGIVWPFDNTSDPSGVTESFGTSDRSVR